MIFGIGTDIVAVKRIEESLGKYGDRFVERILNAAEMVEYQAARAPHGAARFLAKRFAAKEAFSKAFGTGIGEAVGWHDVCVTHDTKGKPVIVVSAPLQTRLNEAGVNSMHISISDEQDHAIAFVVLES